jgi:serine/threonine protein kinase
MSTSKELIGTQLGDYTIADHLATGGMAEIFLARHAGLGRFEKELVLKVLQSRWEEYPEVVEMFLTEARISALMSHPNIVDVFDVAEDSGRHFIVMEHIAGRTLTELAKRAIQVTKSIPIEVGVFIAAELAGALAYMYDGSGGATEPLHVVHRDISPTNVLIGSTGQVKLIDFGIARQGTAVLQESGARPGKVTYMSPEQVRGTPIDGRSDIFCLGTILYEISLGRRLWRGPREVAAKRILEERPKPPTFVRHDYPVELELIVLRTLEKRPEDRYQSATELHQDLQSFLARSNAHLRNSFQMADYVAKIFSEEADALISDSGRRRAQVFVDNEAVEPDQEDLDFDVLQSDGPAAALARSLRASTLGVWADMGTQQPKAQVEPPQEAPSVEAAAPADARAVEVSLFSESARDLQQAAESSVERNAESRAGSRDIPPKAGAVGKVEKVEKVEKTVASAGPKSAASALSAEVPRRSGGVVAVVIVLVLAAAVGVLWLLRGA